MEIAFILFTWFYFETATIIIAAAARTTRQDDIIVDASNNVSSSFEMGDVFIKTREKNTNRRKNALEWTNR